MKFTREMTATTTIRRVSDGVITIGAESYERTIALTPETVFESWPEKSVVELVDEDFDKLLKGRPEVIVLGTGSRNIFPPRELVFAMARRGVGLEVMDTRAAARTFNVLAGEGRKVAAVLYIWTNR